MSVDIPLEIDLGPLAWIKDEVMQTLSRARKHIETLIADNAAADAAKNALDELHQTSGAFELIGIEGLATFTREIERHLKSLIDAPGAQSAPQVLEGIERAVRRLSSHLEEVFSGAPCKPTMLTREYAAMHQLRGSEAGAADLFFPDLNRKPSRLEGSIPIQGEKLPAYLLAARRAYEKGLLKWLRGDQRGLLEMREQVGVVERAFPLPAQRSFWWSVSGFLHAIETDSLSATLGVKQLAGRVDLQIRRFVEGSTKVSDRLRREVLFHVGRAEPKSKLVADIQNLYELSRLLPSPGTSLRNSTDYVSLRPTIEALVAKIADIRAGWQRVVSGHPEAREVVRKDATTASELAQALTRPKLAYLFSKLAEVVPQNESDVIADRLAMEFFQALLFTETTLANFAGDAASFEIEADSLVEQVHMAAHGLDDLADRRVAPAITRRAQERESFRTLMAEVKDNLGVIESAIDAWVRGTAAIDLALIRSKISQTAGVFMVSDQARAATVLGEVERELAEIQTTDSADTHSGKVASIADLLSMLGFYVDAKTAQPDAELSRMLDPIALHSARDSGAESGEAAGELDLPSISVEADVSRQRKALAALVSKWNADPDGLDTRAEVNMRLHQLHEDAKLLGNNELLAAVREAIVALETTADAQHDSRDAIALTETVAMGDLVPLPAVSNQTQSLMQKDAADQDDALLDIYLEEANEILADFESSIAALNANPSDRETLVSVRRGFHTLKGSGRMVGLNELGDVAWEVESHLNTVLQREAPLSSNDRALIVTARSQFLRWVNAIAANPAAANGLDKREIERALAICEGRAERLTAVVAAPVLASRAGIEIAAPKVEIAEIVAPKSIAAQDAALVSPSPFDLVFGDLKFDALAAPPVAIVPADLPESIPAAFDLSFGDFALAEAVAPEQPELMTATPLIAEDRLELSEIKSLAASQLPTVPASLDYLKSSGPTVVPIAALAATAAATMSIAASSASSAPQVAAHNTVFSVSPTLPTPSQRPAVVLPAALRTIVTDEAAGHIAVLTREVERMQFEPTSAPTDEMIRAAHTLKGMHLSVGLTDIGSLAGALESALVAIKEDHSVQDAVPALATAVAALQSLCQCVRDEVDPDPADIDFVAIARDSLEVICANRPTRSVDEMMLDDLGPMTVMTEPTESFTPDALSEMLSEVPIAQTSHATAKTIALPTAEPAPAASLFNGSAFASVAPVVAPIALGAIAVAVLATPVVPVQPSHRVTDSDDASTQSEKTTIPAAQILPTFAPALIPSATSKAVVGEIDISKAAVRSTEAISSSRAKSDPLAGVRDDLDTTVLPIFLEEAAELFPQASAQMRQLSVNAKDVEAMNGLKRTLHTIKGSARMAGAMRLGELAHRMESILEGDGRQTVLSAKHIEEFELDLDGIAFLLDRLQNGEANTALPGVVSAVIDETPVAIAEKDYVADALQGEAYSSSTSSAAATLVAADAARAEAFGSIPASNLASIPALGAGVTSDTSQFVPTQAAPEALRWLDSDAASQAQILRVRADAIERLADETGEVSISRSRMESELKALRGNLNELTSSVTRLRTQVREIEIQAESQIQSHLTQAQETDSNFDPLEFDRFTRFQELTRSLAEGVNDVATVQQSIVSNLDATDSALNTQGRIARSLQNQLQSIRTVAFNSLRERLYRVLRQTAREVGKRANMDIRGGDLSIDRSVLERLAPLVEHVLRNSLAHGIEMPGARIAASKSETGEILVDLRQQGNLVEVTISDDGQGFDIAGIRAKAIAQGLAADADVLTDAEWVEFIFKPGFTTSTEITAVAGRGVGMDVVRTEINALGGRVDAIYEAGKGAMLILTVPLTLTLMNSVLVQIGSRRFGIPSAMVETVKALRRNEWEAATLSGVVQHGREQVQFTSLHAYLGEIPQPREEMVSQAVIVRSGTNAIAIDVDAVYGNQEVVLKRMGPQLSRVPGLVGITLLGDGDIVLLYNPMQLVSFYETASKAATIVEARDAASIVVADANSPAAVPQTARVLAFRPQIAPVEEKALVLVVDDSLTVRKITTRFLEREGFRVLTAKDGMDALTVLSEHKPEVILLDIEMPRMDGFEFTRAAKSDAGLKNIPIIMITSRTAEKHRNHAMELGVNVYLGKPYQDEELLRNIRTFIKA